MRPFRAFGRLALCSPRLLAASSVLLGLAALAALASSAGDAVISGDELVDAHDGDCAAHGAFASSQQVAAADRSGRDSGGGVGGQALLSSLSASSLLEALEGAEDVHGKRSAVFHLAQSGSLGPEETDALLALLETESDRRLLSTVAWALSKSKEPGVAAALSGLARDTEEGSIQRRVVAGLTQLGDEGRDELESLSATAPTPDLRSGALSSLGMAAAGDPLSRAVIEDVALTDGSVQVRSAAIRALGGGASAGGMAALERIVEQGETAEERALAGHHLQSMELRLGAPEALAEYFASERDSRVDLFRSAH